MYEGPSIISRTNLISEKHVNQHTFNIYSFSNNVPCTLCTYPTARPMPGKRDAGRHVTYPANICQRHASTPLLTRTFHHVA